MKEPTLWKWHWWRLWYSRHHLPSTSTLNMSGTPMIRLTGRLWWQR